MYSTRMFLSVSVSVGSRSAIGYSYYDDNGDMYVVAARWGGATLCRLPERKKEKSKASVERVIMVGVNLV